MRALALFLLGAGLALADEPRRMTVDDVIALRNVTEVRISHDGGTVAYVQTEPEPAEGRHTPHIWLVGATRGRPVQLTNGKKGETAPRWSPDGRSIAFISDRGEEGPQVWVISVLGGEARRVTSLEGRPVGLEWAPDGKSLAVIVTAPESAEAKKRKKEKDEAVVHESDLRTDHLHIVDVATGKARQVTSGTETVQSLSWSPSGKEVAVALRKSPRLDDLFDTDLHVVNVETGKARPLVVRPGLDSLPVWSPDGSKVAFVSHRGKYDWIGNTYLCVVDAAGGEPKALTTGFDEVIPWWSPGGLAWSADGKALYFVADQGMQRHILRADAGTGKVEPFTSGEFTVDQMSISRDGKWAAFVLDRPRRPGEVHVSPLEEFRPERRTNLNPGLAKLALGDVKAVEWKNGEVRCEGVLILPVGYREGVRYPLLTYVHGGPQGKHSLAFEPQLASRAIVQGGPYPIHVYAGLGYAIFCPNPRGSGGFGVKFRQANVGDWGGGDFQDILAGIDMLIEKGVADPERLGVMGWSYGGFMTGWAITHSRRFKAASAGAGVYNLTSFYGTTDIPRFMERYFGGTPWAAAGVYAKHSSILKAPEVKTPTLIQHGDADLRVPLSQSQELYRALKKAGVTTELVVYPRQAHLVSEPRLQADMMKRNVEWMKKWIKPNGADK
jgi:dipeptidyl aminopeptidase/acylaminoacyl peptidase